MWEDPFKIGGQEEEQDVFQLEREEQQGRSQHSGDLFEKALSTITTDMVEKPLAIVASSKLERLFSFNNNSEVTEQQPVFEEGHQFTFHKIVAADEEKEGLQVRSVIDLGKLRSELQRSALPSNDHYYDQEESVSLALSDGCCEFFYWFSIAISLVVIYGIMHPSNKI